jgi:hypothetical protein
VYREQVVIDRPVELVGVGDVILNGSEFRENSEGIRIVEDTAVDPRISGLSVKEYDVGINATETDGEWTVSDTVFENNFIAVVANGASDEWEITDSTFETNFAGVSALNTTNDWTVRRSTFTDHFIAVSAFNSAADWRIEDAEFDDNNVGVSASNAEDEWQLANVTVTDTSGVGVFAENATGAWEIRASTFENTTVGQEVGFDQPAANGTAIFARNTEGAWRVTESTIGETDNFGIAARGAGINGDATNNWWGTPTGATANDCIGNVNCSEPLPDRPSEVVTPPVIPPEVAAFDTNGDGEIGPAEAQEAIVALNRGEIDPATAQRVIVALNSG